MPTTTHANEEYTLPSTEAVLAGTLALMTGHVQDTVGVHREAIIRKIVSNLDALTADPMLSPGFKTFLWSLRCRWHNQTAKGGFDDLSPANRMLWHTSPEVVQ